MSEQLWTNERMIAEAETLAADWGKVLQPEQVRLLRQDVLKLLRLCTSQEGRFYMDKLTEKDKRITELEEQLATATITADQRGTLIEGMEEAIDEMQEEIKTLSYCEACGGEMMIEVTWEMPNAAGGYRKIPCTRCDGTGREYVPRLTARITELEAQLADERKALESCNWSRLRAWDDVTELRAQLAAASQWQPVEGTLDFFDNEHGLVALLSAQEIKVEIQADKIYTINFSDDEPLLRLCESRTPAAGE